MRCGHRPRLNDPATSAENASMAMWPCRGVTWAVICRPSLPPPSSGSSEALHLQRAVQIDMGDDPQGRFPFRPWRQNPRPDRAVSWHIRWCKSQGPCPRAPLPRPRRAGYAHGDAVFADILAQPAAEGRAAFRDHRGRQSGAAPALPLMSAGHAPQHSCARRKALSASGQGLHHIVGFLRRGPGAMMAACASP